MILALLACAPEAAKSPCTGPEQVTWDNWAHGFFVNYCTSCHSSQNTERRLGAPTGVDLDSEAGVRQWASSVRTRVIEHQDMPVGGGVYPDDLHLLDVWLSCEVE